MFQLADQLARDSFPVMPSLGLCQVRLMNDARYPWLLLIPEREGLVDLHDMDATDCTRLFAEARLCSGVIADIYGAPKTNVATLGNQVPQLHVHVIGREPGDPAWPGPVWGVGAAVAYEPAASAERVAQLAQALHANSV